MQIYDITRPINPNLAVWPGDTPFSAEVTLSIEAGASINLSTLTLSSHTGTHADAPYHFDNNDVSIDKVALKPYFGPATVVSVQRDEGPLRLDDFPRVDWRRVERLLVHSGASARPADQFPTRFVYPSPELVEFMAGHGVLLFGSDAPSMDDFNSKTLPGHKALRRHGIAILESLLLRDVPDGLYELIALPLKIEGCDGSPVRAILRT